jgi:hypothetical protein
VRVEANVVLEFEEWRWTVGRTGVLRPAVTAGAEGGSELRPSECEGGGVRRAPGGPIGAHARQVAWPAGPRCVGREAWPQRRRAHGTPGGLASWAPVRWARSVATATAGAQAQGRGPGHDD